MRRANLMTGPMAATVLAVATALLSPCLAQYRPPPPAQYQPPPPSLQNHPPRPPGPGHLGDWLRRYKNVPPWEQERALQSDPAFRRLPPDQQQLLRQRPQYFSSLP